MARFTDRSQAGQRLADMIKPTPGESPIVLALSHGGVAVAVEVAKRFSWPVDVFITKKMGVPSNEEFVIGAVTDDGVIQWNEKQVGRCGLSFEQQEKIARSKIQEAQKQNHFFREKVTRQEFKDRSVVVIDDGLATGTTLELVLKEIRRQGVGHITVALPIASPNASGRLMGMADEWVILSSPKNFRSVSECYEDFPRISNDEARALLLVAQPLGRMLQEIQRLAKPIERDFQLNLIAEQAASARVVVLGSSVFGVRELASLRRKISQILIQDHGFNLIAMDADPMAGRELNRWTRGSRDPSMRDMIQKFPIWPRWLYMNEEMPPLLETMHRKKADFFGLDIYSFSESMATLQQLRKEGRSPRSIVNHLCLQLDSRLIRMGLASPELFDLKHNLQIIEGAEKYYEQLLSDTPDLHLLRDSHLFETLMLLLKNKGPQSKIILWAHDLQAGDSSQRPDCETAPSLGQKLRERFGQENVCLIGMGAAEGSRLAATEWGGSEVQVLLEKPTADEFEGILAEASKTWNWNQIGLSFDSKSRQGILGQTCPHRVTSFVHEDESSCDIKSVPTRMATCYDAYLFVCHGSALVARPPVQLSFQDVFDKRQNRRLKPEVPPPPGQVTTTENS